MSIKRKPYVRRVWASDATYPAGALTWSGDPTKVEPSAGVVQAGHTPGRIAPAEWENDHKYKVTSQCDYLDGVEVQNILQIGQTRFAYESASMAATQIFDMVTSTVLNRIWCAGEFLMWNDLVRNWGWTNTNGSNGGSPAGGGWKGVDETLYASGYQIVAVGGGPQITHYNEQTNTWTNDSSPGSNCSALATVRADKSNMVTIAGGQDNGGTPRPHILRYTGVSTLTEVVPAGAASFSGAIECVNLEAPAWYLALHRDAAAAMLWTSTNTGTSWSQQAAAPFLAEDPQWIAYDANLNTHYCITAGGKVYAAVAGSTTWALRSTIAPSLATFSGMCLAVKGSILCALGDHTLWGQRMFYSLDMGATWSQVAYVPLSGVPSLRAIYGSRQLFIGSNATTPISHIGLSLHLK